MSKVSDAHVSVSERSASPTTRSHLRLSPRLALGLAVLWLSLATVMMLRQHPTRDATRPVPGPQSLSWWMHPIETNPLLRMPSISGVKRLAVRPGTNHLFAVGAGGMILRSTDAGTTWQRQSVRWISSDTTTPAPKAAAQLSIPDGADVVERASFESDPKKGPADPAQQKIDSKQAPDPKRQENAAPRAISPYGLEPALPNAANVPAPKEPEAPLIDTSAPFAINATLNDIAFSDEMHGWAVGDGGAILETADGGELWQQLAWKFSSAFVAVAAMRDGTLCAFPGSGTFVACGPGARPSTPRFPAIDSALAIRAAASDGEQLWVGVGPPGDAPLRNIFVSRDGGRRWQPLDERAENPPALRARLEGLVSLANGTSFRATPIGTIDTSAPRSSPHAYSSPRITNVVMLADGIRGWAAGDAGLLLRTPDGGRTWNTVDAATATNVPPELTAATIAPVANTIKGPADASTWRRIVPIPGTQGAIAFGVGATMHRTDDGQVWTPITYGVYPAPWYYAALLIGVAGFGLVVGRRPEPVVAPDPSVADVFVSDRPLERGDPDALSHLQIASGLARFLANEKTEPPLTVAITGEWGTGKTSMMNLTRDLLRSFGFRTVWFNAWHHQTEEHLLGALLESLRRDALPPWWSLRGLRVRVRLMGLRGLRQWGPAVVTIAVLSIAAGYLLQEPLKSLHDARTWLEALIGRAGKQLTTDNTLDVLSILGVGGTLVPLIKSMQTWGASAPKLKSALSTYDPLRDLRLPTGFRHRFADIFRDITRALEPQYLVIFIDDLDRCQPKNVVATLEMINFLVSSGRCIVILGMAKARVERCVGLGFGDLAEVDPADDKARTEKEALARRDEFAQRYLEKLINIELPVPQPNPTQSGQLVHNAMFQKDRVAKQWKRRLDAAVGWAGIALIVAIALVGYRGGVTMYSDGFGHAAVPGPNGQQPVPSTVALVPPAPPSSAGGPTNAPTSVPPVIALDSAYVPAATDSPPWLPGVIVVVLVVIAGIARLARPPVHVEHDSKEFIEAVDRWFPLVHGKTPTPRAIKRFLNRLRFYAMAQRGQVPSRSWLTWLQDDDAPTEMPPPIPTAIPERTLVALSVLQYVTEGELSVQALRSRSASLPGEALADLAGAEKHLPSFLYISRGLIRS